MKRFVILCILLLLTTAGCVKDTQGQAPPGSQTKPAAGEPTAPTGPPMTSVPVLMYHSIGELQGNDAVISRARFSEQMEYLYRNGYRTLTLDELAAFLDKKQPLPPRSVVLTFDDGYRDTYEVAMPILKQYGFKSVMFIPAGDVGQRLSWQELKEMRSTGMQIASHSLTHRELGGMSPVEQAQEIKRSKELLDQNLGQDTRDFCYPNGSYNAETLRLLAQNGFRLAVTIEPGWVKSDDNRFTLRRVWMGNSVTLDHFKERITNEHYPIL